MLCSRNKLHVRVNAIAQYECLKLEFLYSLRAMIARVVNFPLLRFNCLSDIRCVEGISGVTDLR